MSDEFPAGFFDRSDRSNDASFYAADRFVTHIDDAAITAVGDLYAELAVTDTVLDLCSSWISHFHQAPTELVALGMNRSELAGNDMATSWLVHDLNTEPALPFDDHRFSAVTCAVSVDYLTQPLAVFADVARVLQPGGVFVCTFSNRCFPTKAIHGWLANDDHGRCQIVRRYFEHTREFEPATIEHRNPGAPGDPLFAVWARTQQSG